MTHKIRTLLLTLVLGAVLVAFALLVFSANKPIPLQPLPNPNGYDDFVKAGQLAGQLLASGSDYYSATNLDQLQTAVSANSESLRLVKLGLGMECRFPMDHFQTNTRALIQTLISCKVLAQLLAANRRLAELEGRTNDAVTICVETIRIGNEISRGGPMIGRLVGIACEAIGCDPLARLVPAMSPAEARRLIPEIEAIDVGQVPWAEVRRNENAFMREYFRHHPSPILLVESLWSLWFDRSTWKRAEERDALIRARLRLLTMELALRCFRQEHGKVPAKLDELVPAYLKTVPQDPFSGKPLVYRTQGTNWLLYSVGPDGMDNGGVHQGRETSRPGTDLFTIRCKGQVFV